MWVGYLSPGEYRWDQNSDHPTSSLQDSLPALHNHLSPENQTCVNLWHISCIHFSFQYIFFLFSKLLAHTIVVYIRTSTKSLPLVTSLTGWRWVGWVLGPPPPPLLSSQAGGLGHSALIVCEMLQNENEVNTKIWVELYSETYLIILFIYYMYYIPLSKRSKFKKMILND